MWMKSVGMWIKSENSRYQHVDNGNFFLYFTTTSIGWETIVHFCPSMSNVCWANT